MRSSFEPGGAQPAPEFVPEPSCAGRRASAAFAPAEPAGLEVAPAPAPAPAADAEAQLQAAYERGRNDERATLPWADAERLRSAAQALENAARELRELRRRGVSECRTAVVELSLAVARRVLRREIQQDPETFAGLVEQALEQISEAGALTIALSPLDAESVRAGDVPELERVRDQWNARLDCDPRLKPGEARVSSEGPCVDVRLDAVLDRFREGLAEAIPGAEPP